MEDNSLEAPKPLQLTHNRPLNELTYKELQNVAMFFHLPANLKQTLLLTMIQARQEGKEEIVNQILVQYKEQRQRNRKSSDEVFISKEVCKIKRQRISSASDDIQLQMRKPKIKPLITPRNTANITSGISIKTKSILLPQFVSKNCCSATESSLLMQQVPVRKNKAVSKRFPYHIRSLISNAEEQEKKQRQFHNTVSSEFQSGVPALDAVTSVTVNQMRRYPSCPLFNSFSQSMHQMRESSNSFPVAGYHHERVTFSPPEQHEIFNQFSTLPYDVIPISPDVKLDDPFFANINQFQNRDHKYVSQSGLGIPVSYPSRNLNSVDVVGSVTNINQVPETVDRFPTCLEVVLNINLRPITSLKSSIALTNTVNCYSRPLCSLVSIQQCKSFLPDNDLTTTPPLYQEQASMERTSRDLLRFDSLRNESNWSATDHVPQTLLFSPPPDFHHDNQISFPLIYSYLASTENQLQVQQQLSRQVPQHSQQFLQQLNFNRSASVESVPPYSSCPQNISSSHHGIQLPADVPVLDESTLSVMYESSQPNLHELRSDSNASENPSLEDEIKIFNGNPELTPELIKCLHESCPWFGKVHVLPKHLQSAHKVNILVGESGSHLVPLSKVNSAKRMLFFQQVAKRIFLISVQSHESQLSITIQWLPNASIHSERSPCMKGILEVVDSNGKPHNWQGVLLPIWYSPSRLYEMGQCLVVDPADFSDEKYITIHTLICRATKFSNCKT